MIGNDIVDLQLAARQSNWRRKGFLEKVFSAGERQYISASKDSHRMVWLLWSMKEAAYKAHQRQYHLPRKLTWQNFECFLTFTSEKKASGVVKSEDAEYYTASEASEEYIHTSAKASEIDRIKNGIFGTSSEEMKKILLDEISEEFEVEKQQLKLQKNSHGIPFISLQKRPFFESFSFSGHGRYCAFTRLVNDL